MVAKKYHIVRMVRSFFLVFLLFTGRVLAEEEKSPTYESKPDELVIYEGNVSLAVDTFKVFPNKNIRVRLPQGVMARTIEIIDGGEKVINFHLFFSPQTAITGHIGAGEQPKIQATILEWDSQTSEARDVRIRYLIRGIRWIPSYTMNIFDDTKIRWTHCVGISNRVLPLTDVKIKLVSGMVGSIQEQRGRYAHNTTISQRAIGVFDSLESAGRSGSAAPPSMSAARINAYYTYELAPIGSFKEGMNYIMLSDKELETKKEYVWKTTEGEKVDVVYIVRNDSEQPFGAGIVDTYQNGIYMGSDMIEWTPPGSKGHVTIGGAVDLRVEKTIDITNDPDRNNRNEFHHQIELKIENYSKKDVAMKIIDRKYPNIVDVAFNLKPREEKAQTYLWEVQLSAGESKIIEYDFYSDNQYSEPYQRY